jgi:hypothetical protein
MDNEGNIISFWRYRYCHWENDCNNHKAEEMVNKIEYHDIKSYGSWRNNFVIISDDSDQTSDANLQSRQNQLADKITTHKPFLISIKLF